MYILRLLDKALSKLAQRLIRWYQLTLSPDLGVFRFWLQWRVCAHKPHCSAYALQCFKRYSFLRAFHYTMERVSSCTGWNSVTYDPSVLRVVFYSGSPIGVPFLEAIAHDKRYELIWVVTKPDVKQWRWMKRTQNPVSKKAQALSVPSEAVFTPHSLRTSSKKRWDQAQVFKDNLEALQPDVAIVVAYWKILPQDILDIPHFWTINVHWSLLPKYRGASPLQSVFLDDHDASWVTIMKMVYELDAWPILKKLPIPLKFDRTVKDLIDALKEQSPKFCLDTVRDYAKGHIDPRPQDSEAVTFCKKITKEDGEIDFFNDTLEKVYKKYQAYALWPKTYGTLNDMRVLIETIALDIEAYKKHKDQPLITQSDWNLMLNSAIRSFYCKPEGKQRMDRDSFKNWYLVS